MTNNNDIDDKLLEQQEQEQKEQEQEEQQENIGSQFEGGGNGEAKGDEDEALAATKLTEDDINFMFQTMMKESKYDELSIRQTVHGLNSAFTRLPIPHVFTSKE